MVCAFLIWPLQPNPEAAVLSEYVGGLPPSLWAALLFFEQNGCFARFASGPRCPGGLSFRTPNLRAAFSSWAALFLFWNELASCGVHSRPLHHHEAACNVRTNLIGAALRACRAALFCAPSTPFRESVERVTSKNQAFSKS